MKSGSRSLVVAFVVLSALLCSAAAVPVQEAPKRVSPDETDRALFDRLVRQIRQVDRETERLMNQAVAEVLENSGHAKPRTKACLLSLRDERDRLFAQMLILSARHGWETPDPRKTPTGKSSKETVDDVFASVDVLVRRRLTADAQRIVQRVRLPIVSMEPAAR